MNKIIEINNDALTAVTGGCWCYCFTKPYSNMHPTTLVDDNEGKDEESCGLLCEQKGRIFAKCLRELPHLFTGELFIERDSDFVGLELF